MAGEDVLTRSASELSRLLHQGQLSPVALVQGYLDRIERLDGGLHSYITVCADEALAEAKKAEAEMAAGRSLGPLHGLPISLKDQLHAKGVRTTAGSRILDAVPDEDSTVAARLKGAGAIILGKLNMSEFALGGSVEHPFGTPRNPWDAERQPGASSSGSGVAVAASLCWRGHRRLHPQPVGLVRHHRHPANVGPSEPLRSAARILVDGHRGADGEDGGGLRHDPEGHRGPRSQGPVYIAQAGPRAHRR